MAQVLHSLGSIPKREYQAPPDRLDTLPDKPASQEVICQVDVEHIHTQVKALTEKKLDGKGFQVEFNFDSLLV